MSTQTMIPTPPSPQQIHASRLIIATNRGPVEYYLTHDKVLKHRRGDGGMITALIDEGNRMEVTWVEMAMTEGDRLALKEAQQDGDGLLDSPLHGQNMKLRYVAVSKTAYRKHYEVFSNQVLWFLQHYLYNPDENSAVTRRLQDAWTNGYCVANRAIADAVIAEIERENSTAVVMLHDYHLYLAPGMIRQAHPSVTMQQFIHIPWPDVRCWHFLPSSITHDIYTGLIGNDIIGFQAYAQMLDEHPDMHGKVTFLAFLVPSRQPLSKYQRYHADVMKMIEEINQKYGTSKWTPITAFYENDRTRALAAMQYYDVLLVNPIIDGMNLVAKEGPVVNQRNGVLVLSRTAGAFQQLGKGCIPTSPIDVNETSQALYKALTLPDSERAQKAKIARQNVERYDLNNWLTRQIRDINELLDRAAPANNNNDTTGMLAPLPA